MISNDIAGILGIVEDKDTDTETIIPKGAVKVSGEVKADPIYRPSNSDSMDGVKEPLLHPSLALVAPDSTPDAYAPLKPTQVPAPVKPANPLPPVAAGAPNADNDSAVKTLLGQTESMARRWMAQSIDASDVNESVATGQSPTPVTTALTPGAGMPEHREGNTQVMMDNVRRFMR